MSLPICIVQSLIVLFYLVGGKLCHVVALEQTLPPREIQSLQDLYIATNGDNWRWRTGAVWNFTDGSDPCEPPIWEGVTCSQPSESDNHRYVIRLRLKGNRLRGTLPDSIGHLSYLETLMLPGNRLSGTIPATIGNLSNLMRLRLSVNVLTGSIPSGLALLSDLRTLDLDTNRLNGTLPHFIGNLTKLQDLNLFDNQLSGTIPESWMHLADVALLKVDLNKIEGTIPAFLGTLSNLLVLFLDYNTLTGTIPSALCDLPVLRNLALRDNLLTGTIPDCVGNWWNLTFFDVGSNHLHGSLPASLGGLTNLRVPWTFQNSLTGTIPAVLGNLVELTELYLHGNRLTGIIPPQLGNLAHLMYLYLDLNYLTGTIPRELGQTSLRQLYLQHNQLSGIIPPELFADMLGLQDVFLQGNRLAGSLEGLFHPEQQLEEFQILQVSDNQLTGTLPDALFRLPQLVTLAAAKNCITGTLPLSMCDGPRLTMLILDGLKSASACRSALLPAAHSYQVSNNAHGTVPPCLLKLPALSTLHLSGNGLTGTIPDISNASSRLVDLSLSHNALVGSIPASVQLRRWKSLDLSFNRLTGELQRGFGSSGLRGSSFQQGRRRSSNVSEVRYALQNNRFSGRVPDALVSFPNISMLGSNLFSCRVDKSDLPQHDNGLATYQCASNAFDAPYFAFVGILAMAVAIVCGCLYAPTVLQRLSYWTTAQENLQNWALPTETVVALRHFRYVLTMSEVLCQIGLGCTALIVLVMLPWYVSASHYYGTYTHQYAWATSAAFLSGTVPAVVCLCLFVVCIACVAASSVYFVQRRDAKLQQTHAHLSVRHSVSSVFRPDPQLARPLRRLGIYLTFLAVNLCAVVGMNAAFVAVALTQSNGVLFIAQVLLSLFKLFWNTVCTPVLIRHTAASISQTYHHEDFVAVQVVVALFNNIAVPCLVVGAVGPSCFTNVFSPAPEVTSSFTYEQTVRAGVGLVSQSFFQATQTVSYNPPFVYSYQCSSEFITYYAPAFVYLANAASLAIPLAKAVGLHWYKRATAGDWAHRALGYFLPIIVLPVASIQAEVTARGDLPPPTLFDMNTYTVSLITYLGILLTFGVVFPPLAMAMCVTMLSVAWQGKLAVGRFLYHARETGATKLVELFERQCKGAASLIKLRRSLFTITCFACCFYTLFLFDTLGNAEGLNGAVWVLCVVPAVPVVMLAAERLRSLSLRRSGKGEGMGISLDDTMFEMRVRGGETGGTGGVAGLGSDSSSEVVEATMNALMVAGGYRERHREGRGRESGGMDEGGSIDP